MNIVEAGFRDMTEPPWLESAEAFALEVLTRLEKQGWELSLLFCRDSFITELNRSYRSKDEPTDVLSFAQGETYIDESGTSRYLAGDIIISLETLERHSEAFAVSPDEELRRLITHGILHLAGQDHEDNDPSRPMLLFQETLMEALRDKRILP
jgi:probable rRNA maturation factor